MPSPSARSAARFLGRDWQKSMRPVWRLGQLSLRVRLLLVLLATMAVALGTVAIAAPLVTRAQFTRYVRRSQEDTQATLKALASQIGGRVLVTDAAGLVRIDSDGSLTGLFVATRGDQADTAKALAGGTSAAPIRILVPYGSTPAVTGQAPSGGADGTGDVRWVYFIGDHLPDGLPLNTPTASANAHTDSAGPDAAPTPVPIPPPQLVVQKPLKSGVGPLFFDAEQSFVESVNRSLLVAVGVGGFAAVVLAMLLSQRILQPVGALTAAARRLEQGDLSQRVAVRSGDELGQLAHAFNGMAESLSRTDRLRRTMVSDAAHELRTPLSNLCGYLEAVRDGVAEPTPTLVDSLYEEAQLLSHLVGDLQELALADAGQLRLSRRPVAVREAVEQAVQAIGPRAAAQEVHVAAAVAPEVPTAMADPQRLAQVLRNLLANALQHTPPGGRIVVRAQGNESGDAVEIAVSDTGEGIASEHLPYIFERFYRADPSRTRGTGGSGIGLAIVKQLVVAHGGRVSVASAPGTGTTVHFTLPLAVPDTGAGEVASRV